MKNQNDKNPGELRVCVSVKGRFHAFYLAAQLFKRGGLNQLVTSYPKFEVTKYGIPKNLISSILINEIISRVSDKLPSVIKNLYNPQFFLCEMYDYLAAKNIKKGADIFVGWSGVSLKSMTRAKELGMITILERGSSHILYQRDILQEEYKLHGIRKNAIDPRGVEKELREYAVSDYIEVPSSFAKRTFVERGVSPDKIILCGCGVDICQFKYGKKQDGVFRIIHCGGISFRKGVRYLLEAFYELNLPHAELWLIGGVDDEIKPLLKKYLATKNIYLKGPFPQSKLYAYYSQGSVFCLASIEEGLAAVILQAMACGLPVICTENTGGQDVIRDGIEGFIVQIRDVKSLKEKILYMYEHQDRCKKMGKSARQRVRECFTWDAYGDKIASAYTKISR